ncbi:hypothetical protein BH24CHL6_BH24CHL6_07510 [soil metagenome]
MVRLSRDVPRDLGSAEQRGACRATLVRQSRDVPPAMLRAMATLSRTDVEHVAYLARLGLAEQELEQLEGQLNHILDQYAVLAELDTEHIPPTAQTIEVENILREDVARAGLSTEDALANAPQRSGDHIVVPPILGDGAAE